MIGLLAAEHESGIGVYATSNAPAVLKALADQRAHAVLELNGRIVGSGRLRPGGAFDPAIMKPFAFVE
jgi:hypothetical protein